MSGTSDDAQLLDALRGLYDEVDPPPADLVDGVLARLAAEELDVELLALVDSSELAGAVRGTTDAADAGTDESMTLEFAGASYRVLLRIDTVDGRRRVDGWVVPAVPMRVSLVPDTEGPVADYAAASSTAPDEHGRFEFADVAHGRFRIWLHPEPAGDEQSTLHPFATLPFLI
jgi:hypothetical protein